MRAVTDPSRSFHDLLQFLISVSKNDTLRGERSFSRSELSPKFTSEVNFRQFTVKFTRTFSQPGPGLVILSFCHSIIARFGMNFGLICMVFLTHKAPRQSGSVLPQPQIAVKALQLSRLSEHRARMTERTPSVIVLSSAFLLSLGRVFQLSTL